DDGVPDVAKAGDDGDVDEFVGFGVVVAGEDPDGGAAGFAGTAAGFAHDATAAAGNEKVTPASDFAADFERVQAVLFATGVAANHTDAHIPNSTLRRGDCLTPSRISHGPPARRARG